MKKKDAWAKARQGVSAGDLRAILNDASKAVSDAPSKLNPQLTKWQVWNMFHGAISNERESSIVEVMIASNILREFAPDKVKCQTPVSVGVIPF